MPGLEGLDRNQEIVDRAQSSGEGVNVRKVYASILVCCLLGVGTVKAQEAPRFEIYTGYAFSHTGDEVKLNGIDFSVSGRLTNSLSIEGVVSSQFGTQHEAASVGRVDPRDLPAVFPFDQLFSATEYTAHVDQYLYMAGPRYTLRHSRVEPFAHALFGVAHRRVAADATVVIDLIDKAPNGPGSALNPILPIAGRRSDTSFAMAFGGGLDVKLAGRLWLRAVQVDYVQTRFVQGYPVYGRANQNNIKVSAGLVFRF